MSVNRRQVLHVHNKAERKRQRADLGRLSSLVVTPRTETRYSKAVKEVFYFMKEEGIPLPDSHDDLDRVLSQYIEHLWEGGEGRSEASNAVAGLQHFLPNLRKNLPSSWRLLGAWQRSELPCRAPPLTWETLCSICGVFVSQGHTGAAIALCVAFDGMLRTGEMLDVKASDVVISADSLTAVVSLGLTKGGKRRGVEETVVLDDPLVVSLLTVLLMSRKGGQKLIPLSQAKFRHLFAEALKKLDLEEIGFKPYSIRRGGATWYLNATGSMSKVCVKGRWSSEKCARIYVNDGLTTLAKLAFSRKANKLCAKYRSSFLKLIK